jgi:hypothetical protein
VPSGFGAKKEANLWNKWLRSLLKERIQMVLQHQSQTHMDQCFSCASGPLSFGICAGS